MLLWEGKNDGSSCQVQSIPFSKYNMIFPSTLLLLELVWSALCRLWLLTTTPVFTDRTQWHVKLGGSWGNLPEVQWLGLCASTAETRAHSGQGTGVSCTTARKSRSISARFPQSGKLARAMKTAFFWFTKESVTATGGPYNLIYLIC